MRASQSAIILVALVGLTGCTVTRLGLRPRESTAIVETIGREQDAQWTATTWEAVSTPAHRKVLASGRKKTIVGEVVDLSCFLQLGKRGEAHVTCGQKCARNGQPIGILTDEGRLYTVFPEEHHPRRDGEVSLKEQFARLMGKRVRVSGMTMTYNDTRAIFVRTLPDATSSKP